VSVRRNITYPTLYAFAQAEMGVMDIIDWDNEGGFVDRLVNKTCIANESHCENNYMFSQ
jgi:hypothetical protein